MANTPGKPPGKSLGVPSDASKVQPKKETVRINLPPKPVVAATVKIPAPGAIKPAPAAPTAVPASPSAGATQKLPSSVSGLPSGSNVGKSSAAAPPLGSGPSASASRSAPSMRPRVSRAATPELGPIDLGLAVVALIASLGAALYVAYISKFWETIQF